MTAAPPRHIAFVGNCQAFSLSVVYRKQIAPLLGEQVSYVNLVPGKADEELAGPLQELAQADVIVEQRFDKPDAIPAEFFDRPGLMRLRFPYLGGRLYWPYGGVAHVDTPPDRPRTGNLPYPEELGDSLLNKMIRDAVPPDEALRRYDATVAHSGTRIARMAELHLERQRMRDAACGMEFTDYIEANYRNEAVFTTQGHPGLALSRRLVSAVFEAIGVPYPLVHAAARSLSAAPFPPSEMPIHPGVAEVLGLTFVTQERRYRFGHEGYFTFAEFVGRYMAYAWCRDLDDATAAIREGDNAAVVHSLRRGLQQCAGTASAWQLLAHALLHSGEAEEAEAAIRQAMRLGPSNPDVLSVLAQVLLQREDFAGAEAAARQAIALFPNDAAGYKALAKLLMQRRQAEAGAAVGRMAIAREPGDTGALWDLSQCLQLAGRPAEAATVLQQILALEPDNAEVAALLDALAPLPVAPAPFAEEPRRYRPITLASLAALPNLRIDDRPVAQPLANLPAVRLAVPATAFGVAAAGYVVEHPAVPAWLLRNVTVHGSCGLITTGDYAIAETVDAVRLHLLPDAMLDTEGGVHLPHQEPAGNVLIGFHLLGFRTDSYARWLLDLAARFGPAAWQALLDSPGAARAPIVLLPPLDVFWKWETLDQMLPETAARMSLADRSVFVQRLLYVPLLGGPEWLMHPAALPLFDALRVRFGTVAAGRRLFVGGPGALPEHAKRAGFELVEPAELSFWRQVQLFSEATHVIGAHGEVLANLVFCRPGTTVCELRPAGASQVYRHLAAACGLRYGWVKGDELAAVLEHPRFK